MGEPEVASRFFSFLSPDLTPCSPEGGGGGGGVSSFRDAKSFERTTEASLAHSEYLPTTTTSSSSAAAVISCTYYLLKFLPGFSLPLSKPV